MGGRAGGNSRLSSRIGIPRRAGQDNHPTEAGSNRDCDPDRGFSCQCFEITFVEKQTKEDCVFFRQMSRATIESCGYPHLWAHSET